MSLTRKEWEYMWGSIKILEDIARDDIRSQISRRIALEEITKIKNQIQQVIGQME